jgi:hypothetical protein
LAGDLLHAAAHHLLLLGRIGLGGEGVLVLAHDAGAQRRDQRQTSNDEKDLLDHDVLPVEASAQALPRFPDTCQGCKKTTPATPARQYGFIFSYVCSAQIFENG